MSVPDSGKQGVIVQGAGQWGSRVVRLLLAHRVQVAILSRGSSDRRATLQRTFPECPIFTRARDALAAGYGRGIVICTPMSSHAHDARAAINLGLDVLVEKPLATTASDARSVRDLAEDRGSRIIVGHTFLFSDTFQRLASLVAADQVTKMCASWRRPVPPGRDTRWELLPHPVSIALYLFNSPVSEIVMHHHSSVDHVEFDLVFQSCQSTEPSVRAEQLQRDAPTRRAHISVGNEPRRQADIECVTAGDRIVRWDGDQLLTVNGYLVDGPGNHANEPLWNELCYFLGEREREVSYQSGAAFGTSVVETIGRALGTMPSRLTQP